MVGYFSKVRSLRKNGKTERVISGVPIPLAEQVNFLVMSLRYGLKMKTIYHG
jgi:hypothetical protein